MARVEPHYDTIWKATNKVREQNAGFVQRRYHLPNMSMARAQAKDTLVDKMVRIVRAIASEHRPAKLDPSICGGCAEPYPCSDTQIMIDILEGKTDEQRGRDQQSA